MRDPDVEPDRLRVAHKGRGLPRKPPPHGRRPVRTDDPAAAAEAAREAHANERVEDYVEAIDELIQARDECRVSHLARYFAVSHVTALRAVAVLRERGLARTQPHRPIELTPAGRAMAENLRRRHDLVFRFLLKLGVDEETAGLDAEGIEHHLSEQTLQRIQAWVTQQR